MTTTATTTPMQYVRLGSTGLKVSKICLGMMSYGDPKRSTNQINNANWVVPEEQALPFVKRAIDLGINFFDTADIYSNGSSEEITGRALATYAKRDEIILATKLFSPLTNHPNARGLSRKHVMQACSDSLARLGMDYIDLYQIHRWDYDTPIEETMEALNDLVRSGKVRYIGASSMYAWQFAKAQSIAERRGWTKFVSMQNHYNLIYREEEREMIPLCKDQGVGIIPWSPLARGLLCRKPNVTESARSTNDGFITRAYISKDTKKNDDEVITRVVELAEKKGVPPASLSLAWLFHKGAVAPIIGATKMSHLDDAIASLNIKLSEEDIKYIEELYVPHIIAGHL